MTEIVLNGVPRRLSLGTTLAALLREVGKAPETPGIAVALNLQIVPKAELATRLLEPNDRVDIVSAVGGG